MTDETLEIGDTVDILDCPGWTGTVVLIVPEFVDEKWIPDEVWLDSHPGATGIGMRWVRAHFPGSWAPDRPELHAVDVVKADRVRKIRAPQEEENESGPPSS